MSEDYGTCPKCNTPLALAPGIDTYCPNKSCTHARDEMRAAILRDRDRRQELINDAREWLGDLSYSGTPGDNQRYLILKALLDHYEGKITISWLV